MLTEADAPATGDVKIFFHILGISGSEKIIDSLFTSILLSNLYENCSNIYLTILGDENFIDQKWFDLNKIETIFKSSNTGYCEFPAIQAIYEHSLKNNDNLLYIHTKGVTKQNVYTDHWRDYLAFFNINDWQRRKNELTKYDTSGVNLLGAKLNSKNPISTWAIHPSTAPLHYSGNFWWAKSEYIRSLPSPMVDFSPSDEWASLRHMCEMWVCYADTGRHACAWQSGVDHYTTLYPKDIYKGKVK